MAGAVARKAEEKEIRERSRGTDKGTRYRFDRSRMHEPVLREEMKSRQGRRCVEYPETKG